MYHSWLGPPLLTSGFFQMVTHPKLTRLMAAMQKKKTFLKSVYNAAYKMFPKYKFYRGDSNVLHKILF